MLADAASELFESLTGCYALSGGRRLQQMGCMSLSDADSCAMGGCEWDGVSCRPDCSFIPGDPSTCGSGCIYTARVDGCMDCVAGKYATVVGSATVTDCIDCVAGRYAETAGNDNATDCIECMAGKYVDTTGSTQVRDCIECLAGKYIDVAGSDSATDCIDCVAGKYVDVPSPWGWNGGGA